MTNYSPLDHTSAQIRLLHLLPSPKQDDRPWYDCGDIKCTLTTYPLDADPIYEALSYTWDQCDPSIAITVNGENMSVRPNLALALAALRYSEKPRILWVDALCIDQENIHERNHQVRLMGKIYHRAQKVLVWLGRPSSRWGASVAGAMELTKRIGRTSPKSNLPPLPPGVGLSSEGQFDQWIKTYIDLFDPDWKTQLGFWSAMKKERALRKLRRERLPDMMDELHRGDRSRAWKRDELGELLALEKQQTEILKDLQWSETLQQHQLERSGQKSLRDFRDRQTDFLRSSMEIWYKFRHGKTFDYSVNNTGLPEFGASHGPISRNHEVYDFRGSSGLNATYHQILRDLANFQPYVKAIRAHSRLEHEKQMMKTMEEVDMKQQQAILDLHRQIQDWYRWENEQEDIFQELVRIQELKLSDRVAEWDSEQQRIWDECGDLPTLESHQDLLLQKMIAEQCQELENFQTNLELQPVVPFRPVEDLGTLKQAKTNKRRTLRQQAVLWHTKLRRRELQICLEQHEKWQQQLHSRAKNILSERSESQQNQEQLVAAQASWVNRWQEQCKEESMAWEQLSGAWILGHEEGSMPSQPNRQLIQRSSNELLPDVDLIGLVSIYDMPYWSRLWIVQEVLLAREMAVCFGDDNKTVEDWNDFIKARQSLDNIPAHWEFRPAVRQQFDMIKQSTAFQLDRLRQSIERRWPLHALIEITEKSQCQDPRDKIYGLLGLLNEPQRDDIDVDYSRPLCDAYQNVLQWYDRVHGGQDGFPSLVRFSQIIQQSIQGHNETLSASHSLDLLSLNGIASSPIATFTVPGLMKGAIQPLERQMEDTELMRLRQRDWVGITVDYLDNSGRQKLRVSIEDKLVYLDSITTSLAMRSSSSTAVGKLERGVGATRQTGVGESQDKRIGSQFFLTEDGDYGISSNRIREDDLLCQFEDSHVGLILRPRGEEYTFVSKAVLSSAAIGEIEHDTFLGLEAHQTDAGCTRMDCKQETGESTVSISLDSSSLQQLTLPLNPGTKHQFREPLYIHEASFGWYEFVTLGVGDIVY